MTQTCQFAVKLCSLIIFMLQIKVNIYKTEKGFLMTENKKKFLSSIIKILIHRTETVGIRSQ